MWEIAAPIKKSQWRKKSEDHVDLRINLSSHMLNFDSINVGNLIYVLGDWESIGPFRYLKAPGAYSQKNVALVTGKKTTEDGTEYIEINNFPETVRAGVVLGIDVDPQSLKKLLNFENNNGVLEKIIASNYKLQYHDGKDPFFTYTHVLAGTATVETHIPKRYCAIHQLQNDYEELLINTACPPSHKL